MSLPNQSRLPIRLIFQKGRPRIDLNGPGLRLTQNFCLQYKCRISVDGTLIPGDPNLLRRFLKRVNAALSEMRYVDEVARDSLFPDKPLREPAKPAEGAGEQEQADYLRALGDYRTRKLLTENLHRAIDQLELTAELHNYSGDWQPFFMKNNEAPEKDGLFEKWRRAIGSSPEVAVAFKALWKASGDDNRELFVRESGSTLSGYFSESPGEDLSRASLAFKLAGSSLILILQGETPDTRYGDGQLCFRISDPVVVAGADSGHTPADKFKPKEETAHVIDALEQSRLIGMPWSQEEIQAALNDFYEAKGFLVNHSVSESRGEDKTIEVRKVRLFAIRLPKLEDEELYSVLQRILPRREFYELARNEKAPNEKKYLLRPEAGDAGSPLILALRDRTEPAEDGDDLRKLVVSDRFIHFNQFTTQRIGAALRDIDFMAIAGDVRDDPDRHAAFRDLSVVKINSKDDKKVPAHSDLNSFLEASLYKICPRNSNYFYGGLEYRPEQGIRGLGGYKCFKAGPGNAGFEAGGNGEALGRLSYAGVVPLFGTGPGGVLRRPLFLQVEGSSLYERNRLIGNVLTNERRTGGMLRTVLPMLSPADPKQFDLMAEFRRQTVSLFRQGAAPDKLNLTTLEIGARFFLDKRTAERPTTLEMIPRLKTGLGAASQEPAFSLFSLSLAFHNETSRFFEVDLKGRAAAASSRTPLFELPSFGGVETVRGFRQDDVLGLRMWSLQPEIWLRARGFLPAAFDPATGGQSKVRKLLRDSFALAFFSDVGGVYRAYNFTSGTRAGPGMGLRFKVAGQATLRLDWAYGIGDGMSGKGRSRFYFSFDLLENPF